jgi:thioredoxin reductase (NADPH)
MIVDALIVGGGPAGLVAAVYLARFRRSVAVFDAGTARASLIPISHNCPGFPDGIAGPALLQRLRAQAQRYGATLFDTRIDHLERESDGTFTARTAADAITARRVVLATGVTDIEPELPNLRDAIHQGLVRHCPICDGFEVIGKRVAVLGEGSKGVDEAHFIRHFTEQLTLFSVGSRDITEEERRGLAERGIQLVEAKITDVQREGQAIVGLRTDDGALHRFQTLYSSLGSVAHCTLAHEVGVACAASGMIPTDAHQRTSVEGVYACGDIVHDSLNQIAVAYGHAAIAATSIHNSL